jgi:hypothetical protein
MVQSLIEWPQRYEQQKARSVEQDARLKAAERKLLRRRLIEAGGLVDRAGLLELDPNALYGALLSLHDGARDKKQIEQWTALGAHAFAREARQRDEGKERIVITFPAAVPYELTTALRTAGFRFNKPLQHWEGLAHYEEAKKLAQAHGGSIQHLGPASPPFPAFGSDQAAAVD